MNLSDFIIKYGEAYKHPITITNVKAQDQPLVYVNSAFTELCLYSLEEVIGKNCRFLQGKETVTASVTKIKKYVQEKKPLCQDLLNYKKDETIFYNRLVLMPFREGTEEYYIGLQHNLPKERFKENHDINGMILNDCILNPIAVQLFALSAMDNEEETMSAEELRSEFIETFNRIQDFIYDL